MTVSPLPNFIGIEPESWEMTDDSWTFFSHGVKYWFGIVRSPVSRTAIAVSFRSGFLTQEPLHEFVRLIPRRILRGLSLTRDHRGNRLQTLGQALSLCRQLLFRIASHLGQQFVIDTVVARNPPRESRTRLPGLESLNPLTQVLSHRLQLSSPLGARLHIVVIRVTATLPVQALLNDPIKLLLRRRSLKALLLRHLLDLLSRHSGVLSVFGHAEHTPSV